MQHWLHATPRCRFRGKRTALGVSQQHHIPVFMLTAMASTENKVHGFSLGTNDYMTKPFEVSELLARVESLLRSRHPSFDGSAPSP